MKRHHSFLVNIALFVTFALLTTRCSPDENTAEPPAETILTYDYDGKVKAIEPVGTYSVEQVKQLIGELALPEPVSTTSGIELYRVQYLTQRFDGKEVLASGLVGMPVGTTIKGLVSYQHGTNADRNNSISKPTPEEGVVLAALFAGDGYLFLAPDYIGLGISTEVPPYFHTTSSVNAVVDFLKIGSVMLKKQTKQSVSTLYLTGFSQGGHATAAVQRELEKRNTTGLKLAGSAIIAGALNLRDITIPYAFTNQHSFYLGYIANAYASVYGQPLRSLLMDEYARLIPTLFDGSVNIEQILPQLPANPEAMFRPDFLTALKTGQQNWFLSALADNEAYKWKPVANLRLYYGANDLDVSPQEALKAAAYMNNLGGNAEAINLGDLDHSQSILVAMPKIQAWFNQTR